MRGYILFIEIVQ